MANRCSRILQILQNHRITASCRLHNTGLYSFIFSLVMLLAEFAIKVIVPEWKFRMKYSHELFLFTLIRHDASFAIYWHVKSFFETPWMKFHACVVLQFSTWVFAHRYTNRVGSVLSDIALRAILTTNESAAIEIQRVARGSRSLPFSVPPAVHCERS